MFQLENWFSLTDKEGEISANHRTVETRINDVVLKNKQLIN